MKDKKTHLRPFIFGTNLMMLPIKISSKNESNGVAVAVAVVVIVALVSMLIAIIF